MSNASSLYQPPPPPPAPPPHSSNNSLALVCISSGIGAWLMFLGVLAIPCCGGPLAFATGAVAVVTGHIARRQVRAGNGVPGDHSLITIGLIGGYTMVGLCLLGVVVSIALVAGGYLGQEVFW